jgi:hypothetical protein
MQYNLGSQNQSEDVPVYTMKGYGTMEVQLHLFWTSMWVIGHLQTPIDLPAGKETLEIFK